MPNTHFPSLLQPRRRAEHALLAVVQEAWVHGVSTRKVDDLVKALGVDGISKSEVSRICGELDTVVTAFRLRPLTGEHRYLWVDATYHTVRVDGRVVSQATVVVIGITSEGERQVLGLDVGPSEDRAFWTAFLRSLVKRGLKGVRLVISDAHEGLKQAIGTVLSGTCAVSTTFADWRQLFLPAKDGCVCQRNLAPPAVDGRSFLSSSRTR